MKNKLISINEKRSNFGKNDHENKIKEIKAGVRAVGRKDFICWQYRKNGAHRKCPSAARGALLFFSFLF